MKYSELVKKIEDGKYDRFTDRTDVSIEISLCEYGFLRDPKTDECIFCLNPADDFPDDDKEMVLMHFTIDIDEVIEDLNDVEKGYFTFIGSDKETELNNLTNDYLAGTITSIQNWDGRYTN